MRGEIVFCCPQCGGSTIEEIQGDVTVATKINVLYNDGIIAYGEATNENGYVDRYQCRDCGYTIVEDQPDEQSLIEAIEAL